MHRPRGRRSPGSPSTPRSLCTPAGSESARPCSAARPTARSERWRPTHSSPASGRTQSSADGGWSANAEIGTVAAAPRDGLITDISPLTTSAFSLRASRPLADDGALHLSVSQPLRVERGRASLDGARRPHEGGRGGSKPRVRRACAERPADRRLGTVAPAARHRRVASRRRRDPPTRPPCDGGSRADPAHRLALDLLSLHCAPIRALCRESVRNAGQGVSDGDEPSPAFLTRPRTEATDTMRNLRPAP